MLLGQKQCLRDSRRGEFAGGPAELSGHVQEGEEGGVGMVQTWLAALHPL